MFQIIAKLPDHSILSCTLTAKYYKYFDVIEPNNDSRMYICNVNVKTENNLFTRYKSCEVQVPNRI